MFLKNILSDFSIYIGKEQSSNVIEDFILKWRNSYEASLDYILEIICVENNISKQDFFKDSHSRNSVLSRQIFSWLVYNLKHYSPHKIGEYFLKNGLKRNRTTVNYYLKIIENYIETDKEFRKKINEIKRLL